MKGPVPIVVAVTIAMTLPAGALVKKPHGLPHHHLGAEVYTQAPIRCDLQLVYESPDAVFSAGTYFGSDLDPRLRA
jgi:hypothetical protein